MTNINNRIVTMHRGDTFSMSVDINFGTVFAPEYHSLSENETAYFAILECNQRFEDAIVKKVFKEDSSTSTGFLVTLDSSDTEFLLSGEYYYEIKLKQIDPETEEEVVTTIIPRRKFIILE